jgi:hypothetical protein
MSDLHDDTECTYLDPNGIEVLAYRDERHVVLPADRVSALLDVAEHANALRMATPEYLFEAQDRLSAALDRLDALTAEDRR